MDNKKTYTISINGIEQSIKQVDALSDSLQFLEQRIKNLEARSVNITSSSSSSSGGGSRNSELQTEDKLLKQIQQTEEQIRNARREDYQSLLAQKDILKEVVSEAEQRAAAERLSSGNYSNTMKGLKQELSDIKKVMQTTDLGDQKFQEMTERAGVLTNKLKELEQAYGQFGRNVGNYKSAFDDMKKITVQVGSTTREFNSVRDASRQLSQELKAMVINGEENTEEFKELAEAVHEFEMASRRAESAVNDLKASSTGMDDILDMMESFGSMGQISQGFSALFGIDNSAIDRSIQKLVGLQNAMQGIEKIRKQMNTGEGIGAIFSKGSASVDNFVAKITGAQVATNGLAMSSRAATVAVRGLSLALKAVGIGLILGGITALMSAFEKLGDETDTLTKKTNALDESLNTLTKQYQTKRDLLSSSYMKGEISDSEFLSRQYKEQAEYLERQISLLKERVALNAESTSGGFHFFDSYSVGGEMKAEKFTGSTTIDSYSWVSGLVPQLSLTVNSIQEVEEEFKKCNEAVKEGKDYFDMYGEGLSGWLNSLTATVSDTERVLRGLGNIRLGDFIGSFNEVNTQFKNGEISAEQYAAKLKELKNEMNSNEVLQSVLANLDKYIPDEKVREAINNIISDISRLDDAFNMTSEAQIHHWNQVRIDAMAEGAAKIKAQIEENQRHEIAQYGHTQEQISLIQAKYNRQRLDQTQKYNEQSKNKIKQHAREIEEAEKELNQLRIQNMAEGLNKQLAQLEEEKRQKIAKARANGIKVGEITLEIEKLYDKKILQAKEDWAKRVQQVYADMWNKIYSLNHQNAQMNFETQLRDLETNYQALQQLATKSLDKNTASYSSNLKGITPQTAGRLGQVEAFFDKKTIDSAKEYIDMLQKIQILEGQIKEDMQNPSLSSNGWLQLHVNFLQDSLDKEKAKLAEWLEVNNTTEDSMEELTVIKALREQNYSKTLLREYKLRIQNRRQYYAEVESLSIQQAEEQYKIEIEQLKEQKNEEWRTMYNARERELQDLQEHLKKGEISQAKYNEGVERLIQEYADKEIAIQDKYNSLSEQKEQQHQDKIQQIKSKSYSSHLQEYRDFMSRLSQVSTSEPIRDGMWGMPSISKTKQRNNELMDAYTQLSSDIINEKHRLQESLDANEISFDDFQQAQRELNGLQNNVAEAVKGIEQSNQQLITDVTEVINYWVQVVGQTLQSVLDAVWDAQDAAYDKEMDELDKTIEAIREKYQEMDALAEEHRSNIDNIEDELSNSRGSRRERLLLQYQAEIDAEKKALNEKKKAKKEEEKLEKEKEKMEIEQRKREHKRNLTAILISTAMATANGLATQPFIPVGIAMGALATSLGMVQYALAASQKPYAKGGQLDGGVAVGNRHRDGGIKVLGGHAEIEGGEFVTNRLTTSKNIDLLEYINSKKKRININDLIEFYGGETPRKNIQSVRTKFADGGVVPQLRSDIELSDRMLTAFEDYSNRPVQVAVVDIIDRTQQVNEVRTMAGIE